MPPKKEDIPGWNPVSDDEKAKKGKRSRRKGKGGTKDEPTEAGPSSTVPSPSPAQPDHRLGPSGQKPPSSTGTVQTPTPPGARQPTQTPRQPAQATSSSTRPAQSLAQTDTRQAHQASSQPGAATLLTKPTNTPGPSTSAQSRMTLPSTEGPKEKQSISDPTNTNPEAKPPKITHLQHQTRPGGENGVGKQGNTVFLSTNYFKLTVKPGLMLHRYSIAVSPEAKGNKLNAMIKDALNLPKFDVFRPGIVSDFAAFLLSPQLLPESLLKFSVPYKKESDAKDPEGAKPPNDAKNPSVAENSSDAEDPSDPNRYYVKFGFIRTVDNFNATNIQRSSADQGSLPIVQDLDIVLGHHRKSSPDIAMIGKRKAFRLANPRAVGAALSEGYDVDTALLIALRGFFSSVRLSTTGILVNVNVSHGPFYIQRGLQLLLPMLWAHPQVHSSKVSGFLKGLRVGMLHLLPKEILRTISGYASPGQGSGYEAHPPRVSAFGAGPRYVEFFEYKSSKPAMGLRDKEKAKNGLLTAHNLSQCGCDGSYINVYDYFKRKYPSHQVSDKMPVVNVGNTQHPSYLPLSACLVIYQPAKLKLSADETVIIQNFAVRAPYLNANSIRDDGFSTLGLAAGNQKLSTLGINIDHERVTLEGRILPQPTVMYRGDKKGKYDGKSKWNLGGMRFRSANKLEDWACLNIHKGQRHEGCHDSCMENFVKVLNDCGIEASTPPTTHLRMDYLDLAPGKEWTLNSWFQKCPKFRLLLVVLPSKETQLYNRIKQLGDLRYGIQTICVTALHNKFYNTATITRNGKKEPKSTQYNANVALKVNIKSGGVNHVLKDAELGFISEGKTMVVGIDVTHPSPGSGPSATSVAAMVASSDKHLAQWPAEIRINPARQEKVDTLRPMLRQHLIYWGKKHGSFPENLLIYRDGVSEGQYQMVLDEELPQLRAACGLVYGEQEIPRITLIIVGKRHHTRFYRTKRPTGKIFETDEGKDGNPPFGTVVDTVIMDEARNWDFYLQSHTAINGTARPAHYFVLLDEIFKFYTAKTLPKPFKNPSDLLYSITNNMCYLFCRATTSVSIPPPVYYADIACERGRRWNSRVFDSSQSEVSDGHDLKDSDVKVDDALKDKMFYI